MSESGSEFESKIGADDEKDPTHSRQIESELSVPKEPGKENVADGEDKKAEANDDEEDLETKKNTQLNSLIYQTSNESLDSYRRQLYSPEPSERLYFDKLQDGSSHSNVVSPVSSPVLRPMSPLSNISDSISNLLNTSEIKPKVQGNQLFEKRISLDTFTDPQSSIQSLTLKAKHPQFKFRRDNKTFMVGFNNNEVSIKALEWVFDELAVNGDTIIILQVLDDTIFHEIDKVSSNKTLEKIEKLNKSLIKLSLVLEITIGKPQKSFKRAIEEYNPVMLIVGTNHYTDSAGKIHGKENNKLNFWKSNSMSRFFLQESTIPVIAVNPNHKTSDHLKDPIDSEDYFQKWIVKLDISKSYVKKEKKLTILSNSRSSSLVRRDESSPSRQNPPKSSSISNINAQLSRGRTKTESLKRPDLAISLSPSTSRGLSPARTSSPFGRLFGRKSQNI